jgi:hypothetical protein
MVVGARRSLSSFRPHLLSSRRRVFLDRGWQRNESRVVVSPKLIHRPLCKITELGKQTDQELVQQRSVRVEFLFRKVSRNLS